MPTPRKTKGYGWHPDLPDHRDRIYNLERKVCRAVQLAVTLSLRALMPPVYNQLQLGACTGNGVAAVLEYRESKQGEGSITPSRLFIYYGERVIEGTVNEDSGAQIRDGIKVVASEGAPPEPDWPYDITQFAVKPPATAYADAKQHEAIQYLRIEPGGAGEPVKTALSEGSPVVFGFTVPAKFEDPSWNPATEYLPLPTAGEESIGGHCVVVVGYDDSLTRFPVPVYEIRNSWGLPWGDAGHFWMDARWIDEPSLNLSSDFWIIEHAT
jgi:C1A family cysteine protease